jgi:rare lipoprotein A
MRLPSKLNVFVGAWRMCSRPLTVYTAILAALACGPALAESGKASWYGGRHLAACHGHPTAAHRSLAFGSLVRVRATSSGRAITVCISDRGPFRAGRIIDLDPAGATALGMRSAGVVRVTVTRN